MRTGRAPAPVTALKLGCNPSAPAALASALRLETYLPAKLPAPPPRWHVRPGGSYPMLGNNEVGDCVAAAAGHMIEQWARREKRNVTFTTQEVLDWYYWLTGGPDTGLDPVTALDAWTQTGYPDPKQGPKTQDHLLGYATLRPRSHLTVKTAARLFNGVFLAVQLPQSAMDQFQAGQPWTIVPGSPIIGGHAITVLGYTPQWVDIVTWGTTHRASWGWWDAYVMEAFALLGSEWQGDPLINLAQLKRDLAALRAA